MAHPRSERRLHRASWRRAAAWLLPCIALQLVVVGVAPISASAATTDCGHLQTLTAAKWVRTTAPLAKKVCAEYKKTPAYGITVVFKGKALDYGCTHWAAGYVECDEPSHLAVRFRGPKAKPRLYGLPLSKQIRICQQLYDEDNDPDSYTAAEGGHMTDLYSWDGCTALEMKGLVGDR